MDVIGKASRSGRFTRVAQLKMRLNGPQSSNGSFGERKSFLLLPGFETPASLTTLQMLITDNTATVQLQVGISIPVAQIPNST
jgi:hypothetical protein